MKKLSFSVCLFAYLLICLFFTPKASAHTGGGPPFLEVNGKYAQTNPFFSNDPNINIPQDSNPETAPLYINEPISFIIDTDKLLVPPDIAHASTFRWTFDENSGEQQTGKNLTYTYHKAGSHLITLEVKAPGETDFLVIDTVQIDILPDKGYHLPKASMAVETDKGLVSKPVSFTAHIQVDKTAKVKAMIWGFGDGASSKSQNVTHLYKDVPNYATYPVVFRVVDDHGFISDAGIIAEAKNGIFHFIDGNGKEGTIPVSDIAKSVSEKKNDRKQGFSIIALITIIIITFLSVVFFIWRTKKRGSPIDNPLKTT